MALFISYAKEHDKQIPVYIGTEHLVVGILGTMKLLAYPQSRTEWSARIYRDEPTMLAFVLQLYSEKILPDQMKSFSPENFITINESAGVTQSFARRQGRQASLSSEATYAQTVLQIQDDLLLVDIERAIQVASRL